MEAKRELHQSLGCISIRKSLLQSALNIDPKHHRNRQHQQPRQVCFTDSLNPDLFCAVTGGFSFITGPFPSTEAVSMSNFTNNANNNRSNVVSPTPRSTTTSAPNSPQVIAQSLPA